MKRTPGARRFGAPGAAARRCAPSRGRGAPCRRPAASRPWPGRRRRPSQGTARTGCARARAGASRIWGTGPGRHARRCAGGSARGRRPAASRNTARTGCGGARAGASRTSGTGPSRGGPRSCGDSAPGRACAGRRCRCRTWEVLLGEVGIQARDARPARDRRGIRSARFNPSACARRGGPSRPPPRLGGRRACEGRCR